jgi:glycerol-3-phosphate dehydrogenase (NAD(P)+)
LAEIIRIGVKMGADPLTFAGLAGVGDLMMTAGSEKSRNFTVGYRLGKGEKLDHVLATLGSVAEGVETTKAAYQLCRKLDVESPLCDSVYSVLFEGKDLEIAVKELMGRDPSHELRGIRRPSLT